MNSIPTKKIQRWIIGIGVAVFVLGVACVIGRHLVIKDLSNISGSELTVKQARATLSEAESFATMFGTTVAEFLGISKFKVGLLRFALNFGTPLLVIGILMSSAGIGITFLGSKSDQMQKAKQELSQGINVVSTVVKGTVDKATVKCPNCGKVFASKTAFCSSCGTKLPEPPPTKKVCPNCGKTFPLKTAFCSSCGTKLPEVQPAKNICSSCGTVNKMHAAFCANCGTKLGEVKAEESAADTVVPTISNDSSSSEE